MSFMLVISDYFCGTVGIRVFNSLRSILDFAATTTTDYVAQKYIENPLLIHGVFSFDCRNCVCAPALFTNSRVRKYRAQI